MEKHTEGVTAEFSNEEILEALEDVFKSSQPMLVGETPHEYTIRVQALWEEEQKRIGKEKESAVGIDTSSVVETTSDEVESRQLLLEQKLDELSKEIYFSRRGHLSEDMFMVAKGANPDSDEPERMYEPVQGEVGMHFDAHGIDKGNQLESLLRLLEGGVDPSRDFYTAPFEVTDEARKAMAAAVGTSGGTAYKGGLAVVTGGYNESIQEGGIKHVFINDVYKDIIPVLQERFPDVQVHALSEQRAVLGQEAQAYQNSEK